METGPQTSEESEGSVYCTPPSSELDISDIPYVLDFTTSPIPPTGEATASSVAWFHEEVASLREELEEAKRANGDLYSELADHGRSLRELGVRNQRLLEDVAESNKAQRTLTQNVATIMVCHLPCRFLDHV